MLYFLLTDKVYAIKELVELSFKTVPIFENPLQNCMKLISLKMILCQEYNWYSCHNKNIKYAKRVGTFLNSTDTL